MHVVPPNVPVMLESGPGQEINHISNCQTVTGCQHSSRDAGGSLNRFQEGTCRTLGIYADDIRNNNTIQQRELQYHFVSLKW